MKIPVFLLVALLMILHHDFWNWQTHQPLVFGFIPIGLAWHVGISIGAAVVWALAVRFCWPTDAEVLEGPSADGGDA